MVRLQILGTGCATCEKLAAMTEAAATELKLDFALEKVSRIEDIMKFDIPATPALVVDGNVKLTGRLPTEDELKTLLAG